MIKAILCFLAILALSLMGHCQTIVSPLASGHYQFFDKNGFPLASGCLFSYQAGTTTQQATYIDSSGNTTNSNPIILDGSGFADVWADVTKSYKFKLVSSGGSNCSAGTQQWLVDNVPGSATHLFAGDGSCASVGIGFSSEQGTGLIRPSSGIVDVCLAGTDTLKLTSSALAPTTAAALTIGSAARPFSSAYIGTLATNNFQFLPLATVAARKIVLADPGATAALAIADPSANTKVIALDASGLTAGATLTLAGLCTTNCTLTVPAGGGTAATLAGPQTLTNTTLTAPVVNTPTITAPIFNTSMAQGSAFKFQNFSTGPPCSTAASAGATCINAYTWTSPFADSNYIMGCAALGAQNTAVGPSVESITAAGFTVRIYSIVASVASFGSYDCWAFHP